MPGMNGYEVTRKLKNEFSTSHIPIILLTAMGTTENKLEGVESGADAYVTKPFSLKLLLARMVQLIDQREKLREKYVNDPSIERPAIYTSDKDKQFLDKLQAIIEQELGNSEFTMEDFAARMKLGRTVFSKKVRGLTGHTPNEYFRIIRLKKVPEKEWADQLRQTFNTSGTEKIQVEQGIFADGDNKYIDKLVFKKGGFDPVMSYPFTIVVGEKMKGPDDYREVIEQVRKDYRSYLDTCWARELREFGKVEINQEVLKTVNNN